ncbi:MAG: hypothetical protein ABIN05_07410, partial [candidate division WOR-3 bacterium]
VSKQQALAKLPQKTMEESQQQKAFRQKQLEDLDRQLQELEDRKNAIGISNLNLDLQSKKQEIDKLKDEIQKLRYAYTREGQRDPVAIAKNEMEISKKEDKIAQLEQEIEELESSPKIKVYSELEDKIKKLREEREKIAKYKYEYYATTYTQQDLASAEKRAEEAQQKSDSLFKRYEDEIKKFATEIGVETAGKTAEEIWRDLQLADIPEGRKSDLETIRKLRTNYLSAREIFDNAMQEIDKIKKGLGKVWVLEEGKINFPQDPFVKELMKVAKNLNEKNLSFVAINNAYLEMMEQEQDQKKIEKWRQLKEEFDARFSKISSTVALEKAKEDLDSYLASRRETDGKVTPKELMIREQGIKNIETINKFYNNRIKKISENYNKKIDGISEVNRYFIDFYNTTDSQAIEKKITSKIAKREEELSSILEKKKENKKSAYVEDLTDTIATDIFNLFILKNKDTIDFSTSSGNITIGDKTYSITISPETGLVAVSGLFPTVKGIFEKGTVSLDLQAMEKIKKVMEANKLKEEYVDNISKTETARYNAIEKIKNQTITEINDYRQSREYTEDLLSEGAKAFVKKYPLYTRRYWDLMGTGEKTEIQREKEERRQQAKRRSDLTSVYESAIKKIEEDRRRIRSAYYDQKIELRNDLFKDYQKTLARIAKKYPFVISAVSKETGVSAQSLLDQNIPPTDSKFIEIGDFYKNVLNKALEYAIENDFERDEFARDFK